MVPVLFETVQVRHRRCRNKTLSVEKEHQHDAFFAMSARMGKNRR